MGFLDELTRQLLSGSSGTPLTPGQGSSLLEQALQLLEGQGSQPDSGIESLLRAFAAGGRSDVANSWVGTGANMPISGQDLEQVLGGTALGRAPAQAGLSGGQGYAALAQVLPLLVDRLTPNGRVPQQDVVRQMAEDLRRDTGASFQSRTTEGVRMSSDKPKPDFSDVQSGGSSTAPKPAPQPAGDAPRGPRTYTVVAGDSLSKIAKKFYGDANKWRRIHEANKDLIKNPDLIQPGWKLKIPD